MQRGALQQLNPRSARRRLRRRRPRCAGAGRCRALARLRWCGVPPAVLAVMVCSRGRARCPPPGGLRAPLPAAPQSGAAAGSVVLRPLRRPRVPFRGGPGPPRRCPVAARCAPARPRAAALRSGRGRPRAARARLASLPPFPGLGRRGGRFGRCAACSLPCARGAPPPSAASPGARAGAARCPPGPLFPRLSALGACAASFPLRVARRLSPLRGFGLGRPRRARAPLRRGPAAGRPRGARRGPLRRAPSWGARAPPAWGLGFAPLRRRFFCGCCGALLSRAAVWLRPRCSSALPSAAASCTR